MRVLHHWPLDPGSRQVRLALAEKQLDFELESVAFWRSPDDFLALNPARPSAPRPGASPNGSTANSMRR